MKKVNLKLFNALFLTMLTVLVVTSCSKDDDTPKEENTVPVTKELSQKDITDYGKWYYFSFEKGDFVGEGSAKPEDGDDAKWKEKTNWDIAFHRQNVKTNSGVSGKAKAGFLALETEDFDSVKEVPKDAQFTVDEGYDKLMAEFVMPPVYVSSSVNLVANNWVDFEHNSMSWIMAKKNVFIVKTADGKYAKIKFVNFLDDKDESGFLTVKYVYQKDGTMIFE